MLRLLLIQNIFKNKEKLTQMRGEHWQLGEQNDEQLDVLTTGPTVPP